MAVVVWGDLLGVAHDLLLAMRAIERVLHEADNMAILSKADTHKLNDILQAIRAGDLPLVRQLVRQLQTVKLEDLTMPYLRQRASCLRVPHYTQKTKAQLLDEIRRIEAKVAERIALIPDLNRIDGFRDGAGI